MLICVQHLSAARSRISCVSFSRRTGFQSLPAGLHTDHRHHPGTSENTFRGFPLVIAIVATVSRMRGLWIVVRVNYTSVLILHRHARLLSSIQPYLFPLCFLLTTPETTCSFRTGFRPLSQTSRPESCGLRRGCLLFRPGSG